MGRSGLVGSLGEEDDEVLVVELPEPDPDAEDAEESSSSSHGTRNFPLRGSQNVNPFCTSFEINE